MSLERLMAILPPPEQPVETGSPDMWPAVEQRIGTVLPDDYKQFVNRYGTGSIGGFVCVFNPFSVNRFLNLEQQIVTRLDAERGLMSIAGAIPPYPLYPEGAGLLPWAATENVDVFFWRTNGSPAEWQIVAKEDDSYQWSVADGPMTDFLVRILTKKLRLSLLPAGFPISNPLFTPIQQSATDQG